MKTLLRILFFFLLVTQICFGQWYWQPPFTNLNLTNACYTSDENIFIVGEYGSIYSSTDNGYTWQSDYLLNADRLNSFCIVDSTLAFIVGDNGKIFTADLSNPGWVDISISKFIDINDVAFKDYLNGVIVGSKEVRIDGRTFLLPSIHLTTNAGQDWIEKNFDIRGKLNSVYQEDEKVIAVGDSGMILISNDGGNQWVTLDLNTNANLHEVRSCPMGIGIIVGAQGTIFISEDNLQSWDLIDVPEYYNFKSVCAKDINKFVAAGYMRVRIDGRDFNVATIFSSSDGGISWNESFISERGTFNSVSFCNPDLAIAVGDSGLVTIYESTTFVNDKLFLNDFELEQNYPNPFNPSTIISYQLPVSGKVTLKIYDLLGREVSTLVDEEKSAGSFEVEFNPSSINHYTSSGVYFYQLKAGDFIQTKKMILLK